MDTMRRTLQISFATLILITLGVLAALHFSGRTAPPATEILAASVGPIKVGMEVSAISKAAPILSDQDEPDTEGGMQRVIRFNVAHVEVAAEIAEGKVWRMTVSSPGLQTEAGITVGTSLSKFLRLPDVQGHVGEGGMLFVTSSNQCGRSFRLTYDLDLPEDFEGDWKNPATLATLSSDVTIRDILIFECRK